MDERLVKHPLGFWQLRCKPDVNELSSYYAEKYYQTERSNYRAAYSPDELAFFQVKLRQRHLVVKSMSAAYPGRMLDVGCGEGFALSFFKQKGWTVEGIDFSDAGIKSMNPDCLPCIATGDIYQLLDQRMASGRLYDLIWLQNVLEHVLDPVDLMFRLRGLVANAGLLVVTVPNDGSPYQELLFERALIKDRFWIAVPDHISYFTRDGLSSIAAATGWRVARTLADFPIDWFLMHSGSNYVNDRCCGPAAHAARLMMENLIGQQPDDHAIDFYESMARLGLGRSITAFMQIN